MTVDPLVSVGLLLLLLLAVLSWLARKVPGGALSASSERMKLTPQHAVHVVDVAGVRLLVGTGPSGAPQVLARLEEAQTPVQEPEAKSAPLFSRPASTLLGLGGLGAAR